MNTVPSWEGFNVFVLKALASGAVFARRDLCKVVLSLANLDDEQRSVTLANGDSIAQNRIGWSISYLNRVDAIDRPARAQYCITEKGRELLRSHPQGIGEKDLRLLAKPDDQWWVTKKSTGTFGVADDADADGNAVGTDTDTRLDPIEQIQQGIARINDEVSAALLSRLQGKEPAFFEKTVVDLLLAMGYGGAHGKGTVTQLTNDGGIDGVIDQDALGLNQIFVQAKRYSRSNTVERPEVQSFVGALSGKADRGLFITTNTFSKGAVEYARNVPTRVILIDGHQLTQLMIRYEVGVQVTHAYRVVGLDEDFFV
ncbi:MULTISPECIES: restriction endonuclease [Bifidobacterium]|jgi:restriction system protein|uniref:Restriction endonuclease n=1 Tax=Bifidobacterium tibiigranuli TaxID=2172043 RepID=A0A5N6RVI5_9BIFI|nr:restriction endonuclease [Bifidobacterium tibiigranuli]KAE8126312.1 restriction endonuclease [Bifidobacterium tibiigranuli]KAE8127713.1 restriction endonuclease [Bifidobacterium tibiigranuli]MCI1254847.1 restriction endonuclease [Bifidobacterium tibiigranuli]